MIVQSSPQIVSDYCDNYATIRVNRDYQRSGNIWPKRAKSALIETVILGYPMPAMYLHQCYDKEARRPYKDLVDGQQRTECLIEFSRGELQLSKSLRTECLRGKGISDLEPDQYESFMSYSLPIFLFTQATEAEVREAFRRINSYNAVLNPHEIRHSTFQGEFKWFVHGLTGELGELLLHLGILSQTDMVRMKDTLMVAEICFMYLNGIRTTKQEHITKLYQEYDDSFEQSVELRKRVIDAFDVLTQYEEGIIHTPLAKTYQIGMLVLAIMHAQSPVKALEVEGRGGRGLRSRQEVLEQLSKLAGALQARDEADEDEGENEDGATYDESVATSDSGSVREFERAKYLAFRDFVRASTAKTNTGDQRKVRFRFFLDVVSRAA